MNAPDRWTLTIQLGIDTDADHRVRDLPFPSLAAAREALRLVVPKLHAAGKMTAQDRDMALLQINEMRPAFDVLQMGGWACASYFPSWRFHITTARLGWNTDDMRAFAAEEEPALSLTS